MVQTARAGLLNGLQCRTAGENTVTPIFTLHFNGVRIRITTVSIHGRRGGSSMPATTRVPSYTEDQQFLSPRRLLNMTAAARESTESNLIKGWY